EHSRVFRFGNGLVNDPTDPGGEYWIGSADLMHRNLDRRVEALVQVTDPTAQAELDRLLTLMMSDDSAGFDLAPDGSWHRRTSTDDHPLVNPQEALLRRIVARSE